jgi:ribonuclease BN (tRNA processing enzyme)
MEIVFLGTGGGRINLIKQLRATGGFRINSESANIQVDPGPGALVHSNKNKQDPLKLDCIIVTHNHTDHVSDAQVMIEAMTGYCLKKRGVFIASKEVFDDNGISSWHQTRPKEVWKAEPGKKRFETGKGSFEIEIINMKHEELSTFGFKLYIDGKVIGHISDSEYVESFGKDFAGCDILIVNVIKPESDKYSGHLTSSDLAKVLKEAKPKQAVVTHLGLKMLKMGPSNEAKKIEDASGIKTIAAKDGMRINL